MISEVAEFYRVTLPTRSTILEFIYLVYHVLHKEKYNLETHVYKNCNNKVWVKLGSPRTLYVRKLSNLNFLVSSHMYAKIHYVYKRPVKYNFIQISRSHRETSTSNCF